MKTKDLFFGGIILFLVCAGLLSAQSIEPDPRREQLRQEAQASYGEISRTLTSILTLANVNRRPQETQIQQAAELLETNRRFAGVYDTSQKAGYMLLQSWVAYYQNDPVSNLNWAVRACREDPANGDAWISQTLFSFIYGRRPVEPQPPRPQRQQPERRPQRTQPRGRQVETVPEPQPAYSADAPFGRPGTLDFDLNTIRRDFMRERFTRQEYMTADNKKVVYTPGSDVLCILFWQAEEPADPNAAGLPAPPAARAEPAMMPLGAAAGRFTLQAQQRYFKELMDALAAKKHVKFVEMNVNSAAVSKDAVMDYVPVASPVIAAMPQSGALPFARMDVPVPFLAIIDNEGLVKYAGVAAGLMPAFILSHLTETAIDLTDLAVAPQMPGMGDVPLGMPAPRMPVPMMPDPLIPGDPNRPVADPNHLHPSAQAQKQYQRLPEELAMQAEKELIYARDLFGNYATLPGTPYTRFVDACREIIRKYPDTEYADQARKQLARVPERLREEYRITPEELGQ